MKTPSIWGRSNLVVIEQMAYKLHPVMGAETEKIALNAKHIEAIYPSVPPKDVFIDMINGSTYKIPDIDINTVIQAYTNAMK